MDVIQQGKGGLHQILRLEKSCYTLWIRSGVLFAGKLCLRLCSWLTLPISLNNFYQRPVLSTPEEFENGGITLKTHQILSVDTASENLETQQSLVIVTRPFQKAPFSKWFLSSLKAEAIVFKFLRFEERFREARFREGLVWTVGLTVEIELSDFKCLPRGVEAA